MVKLFNITKSLLLEQSDVLSTLRKSITERKPITIDYAGPANEVMPGKRIDIEPIVLGKNARSGNLVIWAYVFSGVSKKGLPNWKMFRVDRIQNVEYNPEINPFELKDLPGYEPGKAPNAMKSLSSVDVYSPYWYGNQQDVSPNIQPQPERPEEPEYEYEPDYEYEPETEDEPENIAPSEIEPSSTIEDPDISGQNYSQDVVNTLGTKINDINGRKSITSNDYQSALRDLYNRKEGEWKNYQRSVGGNIRPGEGTRARFDKTSKQELDNLLAKNKIEVSDISIPNNLSEMFRRFKVLINL
jgi:hypothetical protein